MLTHYEVNGRRLFHVVGRRLSALPVVLATFAQAEAAEAKAAVFRRHLENYDEIAVEPEAGPVVRERRSWGTTCRHCLARRIDRPRGLCHRCFAALDVRALYPTPAIDEE